MRTQSSLVGTLPGLAERCASFAFEDECVAGVERVLLLVDPQLEHAVEDMAALFDLNLVDADKPARQRPWDGFLPRFALGCNEGISASSRNTRKARTRVT